MIRFRCPCGQALSASEEFKGVTFDCPKCKKPLRVPYETIAVEVVLPQFDIKKQYRKFRQWLISHKSAIRFGIKFFLVCFVALIVGQALNAWSIYCEYTNVDKTDLSQIAKNKIWEFVKPAWHDIFLMTTKNTQIQTSSYEIRHATIDGQLTAIIRVRCRDGDFDRVVDRNRDIDKTVWYVTYNYYGFIRDNRVWVELIGPDGDFKSWWWQLLQINSEKYDKYRRAFDLHMGLRPSYDVDIEE